MSKHKKLPSSEILTKRLSEGSKEKENNGDRAITPSNEIVKTARKQSEPLPVIADPQIVKNEQIEKQNDSLKIQKTEDERWEILKNQIEVFLLKFLLI